MDKYDKRYFERQIKTVAALRKLYDDAIKKIIAGIPLSRLSPDERFAFEKYPEAEKRFKAVAKGLDIALLAYINSSTREVWDLAKEKNDALLKKQFDKSGSWRPPVTQIPQEAKAPSEPKQPGSSHQPLLPPPATPLSQPPLPPPLPPQPALPPPPSPPSKPPVSAYDNFRNREVGGLNLSQRVWNINGTNFKKEIEIAVQAAIEQGKSAAEVSRDIRKYLNNPDALFRRVRDKDGNLQLSKAAKDYHPGQGVYRSAYKNAMRLARNEINMAYRESDYLKWQDNPSIIGFRIQNANRESTVCELCKRFNGLIFPKTFRWLGFHVQCMCTAIPVFASDAEVARWERGEAINPELPNMPEEFVKYLKDTLKEYENGGKI